VDGHYESRHRKLKSCALLHSTLPQGTCALVISSPRILPRITVLACVWLWSKHESNYALVLLEVKAECAESDTWLVEAVTVRMRFEVSWEGLEMLFKEVGWLKRHGLEKLEV
jgi:hypothetical protein